MRMLFYDYFMVYGTNTIGDHDEVESFPHFFSSPKLIPLPLVAGWMIFPMLSQPHVHQKTAAGG